MNSNKRIDVSDYVHILGIKINIVNYETTLSVINEAIIQKKSSYICVCPVHSIIVSQTNKSIKTALNNSLLTVADGMPVVWAMRILKAKIKKRVYGPNLMLYVCKMAEKNRFSIFLYGGTKKTLKKLQEKLQKYFPDLIIKGAYSPPFRELTENEKAKVLKTINSANPDLLFIGLGAPKQEKWMAENYQYLNTSISIGVGAAFDFISGEKNQAPVWMQNIGLEWYFRLLSEPKRLFFRYLVGNSLFILLLIISFLNNVSKLKIPTDKT